MRFKKTQLFFSKESHCLLHQNTPRFRSLFASTFKNDWWSYVRSKLKVFFSLWNVSFFWHYFVCIKKKFLLMHFTQTKYLILNWMYFLFVCQYFAFVHSYCIKDENKDIQILWNCVSHAFFVELDIFLHFFFLELHFSTRLYSIP